MNRTQFFRTGGAAVAVAALSNPLMAFNSSVVTTKPTAKIIMSEQGKVYNVLGDALQLKLNGADTGGLFTMYVEEHDPGAGIPLHVHTKEDEVFQIQKGQVEFVVGDTTQILGPGDIAFGPKNIPHSWKNVGSERARVNLLIYPSGVEDMFTELAKLPAGPPDFAKVSSICSQYGISFL
jgi:quercetin dioxygenase-like cupin family protein